eukprot:TRINITY_DN10576_c0_g1_i3.p1 TRINITY_DN10576_c0_g1~~TRINITY_DN10576_c0_g1_i3.p1  ORF type:complete len:258 (+),score=46.06 TRINITY_DN10576_c0_g1_i3:928-1701(+)
MKSLEKILADVCLADKQTKKVLNRRFIVVEALYQNSGKIAPLDKIMRLKEKFRFRLMVDESNSFGVLGKTGRGISEHYQIPTQSIDIITAGMGYALASTGGFCTGSAKVVDHQRLSGQGYCFSASLPPYSASAAIAAIDILEENPEILVQLRENTAVLVEGISKVPGIKIVSDDSSPLIFLQLDLSLISYKDEAVLLNKIVERMLHDEDVLLSVAKRSSLDSCKLPYGIRLCVSAGHTKSDLLKVVHSLKKVIDNVL